MKWCICVTIFDLLAIFIDLAYVIQNLLNTHQHFNYRIIEISTVHFRDKIRLESVIFHGPGSAGEGIKTTLRVIAPSFVKYVTDSDTFESNYTFGEANPSVTVNTNYDGVSITDISLEGGVYFPDVISLNFTLSVDPEKERPVGSGDLESAIVMYPICKQSVFADYPADTDTFIGCGSLYAESFTSSSPGKALMILKSLHFFGLIMILSRLFLLECYDDVPLPNHCQVTASSQLDENSAPHNALTEDKGSKVFHSQISCLAGSKRKEYASLSYCHLPPV